MTDINPLQARLTPYVDRILASAKAGSKNAQQIISLYNMYVACPEDGAATLCDCYFRDWLKETGR